MRVIKPRISTLFSQFSKFYSFLFTVLFTALSSSSSSSRLFISHIPTFYYLLSFPRALKPWVSTVSNIYFRVLFISTLSFIPLLFLVHFPYHLFPYSSFSIFPIFLSLSFASFTLICVLDINSIPIFLFFLSIYSFIHCPGFPAEFSLFSNLFFHLPAFPCPQSLDISSVSNIFKVSCISVHSLTSYFTLPCLVSFFSFMSSCFFYYLLTFPRVLKPWTSEFKLVFKFHSFILIDSLPCSFSSCVLIPLHLFTSLFIHPLGRALKSWI